MKIGVITVYNSLNYGAFLQAFAMQNLLEARGHEVCFIKTNTRHPFLQTIMEFTKRLILSSHRLEYAGLSLKKYSNYVRDWKCLNIGKRLSENASEMDCVLFGSDEIWNIKRKEILRYPVFFGIGVDCKNKIAFAPSVNNASEADFREYPNIIDSVAEFRYVAVRGQNTLSVLNRLLNKKVDTVLDPTLLIDKMYYDKLEKEYENSNYFVVYSYGKTISEDTKKKIIAYARKENKKLVSVLTPFSWCDENPQLSVGQLIHCFKGCDGVFTNTFHGTIFSIIFNKDFCSVIDRGGNKVSELLDFFDLKDRVLGDDNEVGDIMSTPIDYYVLNEKVDDERRRGNAILDRALMSVVLKNEK